MAKLIYLDNAAATPLDTNIIKLMTPYYSTLFYNPSANYHQAAVVKQSLNSARNLVAHWLGVKANEIIFTAGGTEANNLAIAGVMKQFPAGKILISSIEHESISRTAAQYDHLEIKVKSDGILDIKDLEAKLDDQVVLISIMYANNEIGVIEPLAEVARLIEAVKQDRRARKVKQPLYFHTDACQAANYLDLHVQRLGVDMMTLNGGKIYGPKQSGALYVKYATTIKPLIIGGGQERNLRSGTENVAADIGLAAALDMVQKIRHQESARLTKLRDYFIERLQNEIPGTSINGSLSHRLANNVHATFEGVDNEALLIALDQAGIMAAAGSACSAAKAEASHVLLAINQSEQDARSSLRFSLGRFTSKRDIDQTMTTLKRLVKNLA